MEAKIVSAQQYFNFMYEQIYFDPLVRPSIGRRA